MRTPLFPEHPTAWARWCLMLCALCALMLGPGAQAKTDGDGSPPVLYVLTSGDLERAPDYEELRQTLGAHLTALDVDVRVLTVDGDVDADLARRIVAETSALAVGWIGPDVFHLLTPALGPDPRTRALEGAGTDWLQRCQAIAAMTHAELEPVLDPPAPPPPAEDGAAGGETPAPDEREPPPAEAEPTPEVGGLAEEEPRPRTWAVMAGVGYTLARPGIGASPLHGVGLGLGARFGRNVGVLVEFDLTQAVPLTGGGDQARIARWPLRISLGGEVAVKRVDLVGRVGVALDISRVRGLDLAPADPAVVELRTDLGIAAAIEVRLRVLRWLAPFVAGGLDLHTGALAYELAGEEIGRRGPVVPRLHAGVTWILGPEGTP